MSNTWKQYGGIRKQNALHNLSVGTLIADQVLVRESYAGKFKIPGSIYVAQDVVSTGNVVGFSNNITSFDNYIGRHLYLNKYLYFGAQSEIVNADKNNHAFINGGTDFSANNIGINTSSPNHTLDIKAITSSQTNMFSVSSKSTSIKNTLGQNINNHGIALQATDGFASLGFYVDSNLNYGVPANAQINYQQGGNLILNSPTNTTNSGINTVINSITGYTNINSATQTNVTSGISTTISTLNTNIYSKLAVSNRGATTNLFNETLVLNDISNGYYLYDVYENKGAFIGSSATMIANGNNSNTFLRLVTPNKSGLSIGAGTFPNDQTRSMAAFGLTNSVGNYKVNQTIVSGNIANRYYTTTGFNTYAPRTENYVVDINGPTHISNGEINKMAEFDYEILKVSFSKLSKGFGIAVGSPSTSYYTVDSLNNGVPFLLYPQYVSITKNGGLTWNSVRFTNFENGIGNTGLEALSRNFTVFTYNEKRAMIATGSSYFFYTVNGGTSWWPIYFNDSIIRDINSIYISKPLSNDIGPQRVFLTFTLHKTPTIPPTNTSPSYFLLYFDLDFGLLQSSDSVPHESPNIHDTINYFVYSTSQIDITKVNANDGLENYIYFVGEGIRTYQIDTQTLGPVKNSTEVYNDVFCLTNFYIVAVGVGIISYSKNSGSSWTNISNIFAKDQTTLITLTEINLKSVFLLDANYGMAVGDNGIVLYTNNGSVSWSIVPDSILNTSGYGTRINGPGNYLRNIFMSDSNNFSITRGQILYNANSNAGLSKIYSLYLPSLYNGYTNNILDVSGGVTINGNLNISDPNSFYLLQSNTRGNINTRSSTFDLLNKNALTINFGGDATAINIGNSSVVGLTTINTGLSIKGNVNMTKPLNIESDMKAKGDLEVGGNAKIQGKTDINGNVNIGGYLDVTENAVFNKDITVLGKVQHALDFRYLNRLYVEQDTYLYERVFVGEDISLNGNVQIGGVLNFSAIIPARSTTITIIGYEKSKPFAIPQLQSLKVGSIISSVDADANFASNLIFEPNTQIEAMSSTKVPNDPEFLGQGSNDYITTNVITLNKATKNIIQIPVINIAFQNSQVVDVFPDMSLNLRLYVNGDASLNSRLAVVGDVSLGGNLKIGNSENKYVQLNPTDLTYNYGSNQYNTLPLSKFQYLQTLTQSVQEVLNVVQSKTGPIGIVNAVTTYPTNLTLGNITPNAVTISFTGVQNVTTYKISITNTSTTTTITPVIISTTTYTITGLTNNNSYKIFVGALDNNNKETQNPNSIDVPAIRDFSMTENENFNTMNEDGTSFIDPILFGVSTDDTFFVDNQSTYTNQSRDVAATLLTFDLAANNVLVAADLIPTSPFTINIGNYNYPANNIFINNQNPLTFISTDPTINPGSLTFNTSTGLLDISYNGQTGSSVFSYGGNVSIGKPRPSTTLDVLGISTFNGDINQITGNTVLRNKLSVLLDVSIGGNLFSNKNFYQIGDSTFAARTFLNGDVSINSNLFVSNDTSLNSRLFVKGDVVLNGDVSLNSNLNVRKNAAIVGDLSANGNLYIRQTSTLNGDTTINGNIIVNKKAVLNSDVSMIGNLSTDGYVYLNNGQYLKGNLTIVGSQTMVGNVLINGFTSNLFDVKMFANLVVDGDTSLNNNLRLQGNSFINNNITVNKSAFVKNDLSLNGNLLVGGTIFTMQGDSSLNGSVSIGNRFIVGGDGITNGNLIVNKTFTANTNAFVNNSLFVTNDSSFSSNVFIDKKLTVNNDLSVNGNINTNGSITAIGDLSSSRFLYVTNDSQLNGNLRVAGNSFFTKDLTVTSNIIANSAIINGNTNITGRLVVARDISLNANLSLNGAMVVKGDTNLLGNLVSTNINTGTATVNNMLVYNDILTNSNLYIAKNTINNGTLTVGLDSSFNGNLAIGKNLLVNGSLYAANYPVGSIPLAAIYGGTGLSVGSFDNNVRVTKSFYVGGESLFSGNVTLNKDLTINGQLIIKQYTVNQTITTLSYEIAFAEDLSVNGRVYMSGDCSINSRLFVGADTSLNANLFVLGNSYFTNSAIFGNTITTNGNVTNNATFINNALSIFNSDVSLNQRFSVFGISNFINEVSMNQRLFVQNDTSLNANLFTKGLSILNNDVSMNSKVYVQNDTSLNANLFVKSFTTQNGDVSMNSRLYVQKDTSLNANLSVFGMTIQNGDLSANNRLFVQSDSALYSRLIVQGQTTINNDISINNRLFTQNDTSLNANLYVNNKSTLNSDVSMNTKLYVANDTSLNSNLFVAKNTIQLGDVSMNQRLYLGSDASLNSNLFVGGKTFLQNDLSLGKTLFGIDASYTGNVAIYGNLYLKTDLKFDSLYVKNEFSFSNNVYITGQIITMVDASLSGNLIVIKDSSLNGRLVVAQDTSFNKDINVLGDSSLNRRFFVGGDTSLNGNLFVANKTVCNGDVSMVSSLDLNGTMIARNNMNVYGIINQYNTLATPQNTIVNNTSYVTSNASQVTLGTSPSQIVYVPGNIGIGTNNPSVPLYINKSSLSTGQDSGFYYNNAANNFVSVITTAPYNYSIYASNSIATADKLIATSSVYFSDQRIKTDIQDIDENMALDTIRNLKPKKYQYIDTIGQGNEPTWGFIAQEVKPILPHSVSISKNFIPNIYELAIVCEKTIELQEKTTNFLQKGSLIKAIAKDQTEIIITVNCVINDKMFIIDEPIHEKDYVNNQLFIYGQQIDDFNNLDKNAIFTVTTAALKKVDKELETAKLVIQQQADRIETLENQMKIINDKLQFF